QYRNILVWRGTSDTSPFAGTACQPPHDIPDKPVADYLPTGPAREILVSLMEASKPILADHPVNQRRIAEGKKPATQVWLWGQGKAPRMHSFRETYGPSGAIISAVDLVRGVGVLLGWHRVDVPGATGYLDTNYAAGGVPFAACGTGITPDAAATYDEPTAAAGNLAFAPGWHLMRWFLSRP